MNNNNYGYGSGQPQGNPPPYGQGAAASYYSAAGGQQQHQQHQQPQSQAQYHHQTQYQQPPQFQQGQQSQQFQQGQQGQQFDQDGPTGERGVLGAIGGGVAGAVGGNKVGGKFGGKGKTALGTVLGAVAGAVAGHKLQDGVSDWKENRDEEKEKKKREEEEAKKREEEEKRRKEEEKEREKRRREDEKNNNNNNSSARPHNESRGGVNYAGNFSSSSRDIRLDAHGEYMLHAACRRTDGSYQASSISLNKLLENDHGSFRWSSGRSSGGGHSQPATVTVQPGDTLRGIAARVGCSFEEIARLNGIPNPDLIHPGQVFQIPGQNQNQSSGGGAGNFGASARNVRLADGGRRLEGELSRNGNWVGASIVLDERIGNKNGTLTFV